VVGQGDRRHARLGDGLDHVVEAIGPVEEAELAMEMEMDEVGHA
jgi:hypothetical protein